jgi:hypothetical protein
LKQVFYRSFELRAKNNLIFGLKTAFLKTRTIRVISPPSIFLTKGQGFGISKIGKQEKKGAVPFMEEQK